MASSPYAGSAAAPGSPVVTLRVLPATGEVPAHLLDHVHTGDCHHKKVKHGDHFDLLVGTKLVHEAESGLTLHGELDMDVGSPSSDSQALIAPASDHHYHHGTSISREEGLFIRLPQDGSSSIEHEPIRRRNAGFLSALSREMGAGAFSLSDVDRSAAARKSCWGRLNCKGDSARFAMMLCLTGGFAVVEMAVGLVIHSLALQADAYHMLSDLLALLIGLYASRATKKRATSSATFGFVRWEVVGALINSVFLLATSFNVFLEAIQRLGMGEGTTELEGNSSLMLIVGGVGLGINLAGLVIFSHGGGGGHGHSHGGGGHGHSHGSSTSSSSKKKKQQAGDVGHGHSHSHGSGSDHSHSHSHGHGHSDTDGDLEHGHSHGTNATSTSNSIVAAEDSSGSNDSGKARMSMNVHGVLLHVAGDALGSIGVMISAAIIAFTTWPHREVADPLASLFIVFIIAFGTIPLLRQSVHILLELVPLHVDLTLLRSKLLSVPGVLSIHDLHVWTLDNSRVVGSLHVIVDRNAAAMDYRRIIDEVKATLHDAGVHASTVQPEFVSEEVQRKIAALATRQAPPVTPVQVAEAVAAGAIALPADAVLRPMSPSDSGTGSDANTLDVTDDEVIGAVEAGHVNHHHLQQQQHADNPASIVTSQESTPRRPDPLSTSVATSVGSSQNNKAHERGSGRKQPASSSSPQPVASFYLDLACDEIICGQEECKTSHCCPQPQSGPFTPPRPSRK